MQDFLRELDLQLFHFFNGLAGRSQIADFFFIFSAEYLIFFMAIGVALFWFFGKGSVRVRNRMAVATAFLSGLFGRLFIIPVIRYFYFRPRPFVRSSLSENIQQLVPHDPGEAAFPSGHATVLYALAFGMFLVNRIWGILFFIAATISSLARIVVGVHFPFDIVGGFFVALLSTLTMRQLLRKLRVLF